MDSTTTPARPRAEQLEQAKQFLRAPFAADPLRAAEVRTRATQAGISIATLQRARDALGIHARKVGNCWLWIPTTTRAPVVQKEVQ